MIETPFSMENLCFLNQQASKAMEQLQEFVKLAIKALPENPEITPLNEKCYVLPASSFSTSNWSAEYYSFKHQYGVILDILTGKPLSNTIKILKTIMKNGKFNRPHNTPYQFHPDVVLHLCKIFDYSDMCDHKELLDD